MIPGRRVPDRIDAARDQLARAAEGDNPGWDISHGIYGWTGTRACDQRTAAAPSLPGLLALINVADTARPSPSP